MPSLYIFSVSTNLIFQGNMRDIMSLRFCIYTTVYSCTFMETKNLDQLGNRVNYQCDEDFYFCSTFSFGLTCGKGWMDGWIRTWQSY